MKLRVALVGLLLLLLMSAAVNVLSGDTINPGESLLVNETLVSAGKTFVLGFFSPDKSSGLRYLGIWYYIDNKTVVWVANRDSALRDSNGILNLAEDGKLSLFDNNTTRRELWSTPTRNLSSPTVQLLDTGNLILGTASNHIQWQSFDQPSDKFLPGIKLGRTGNGKSTNLTSWKRDNDPNTGDYTYKMNDTGIPQLFLWKGNDIIYRSGPWNGRGFSGRPEMKSDSGDYFTFDFVSNGTGVYYNFEYKTSSILSYVFLSADGFITRYITNDSSLGWNNYWNPIPEKPCDNYKTCGPFAVCTTNRSATCQCLDGFSPKWTGRDYSSGCARLKGLGCMEGDTFNKVEQIKLPDTSTATSKDDINDCRAWCLNSCSCTAYAFTHNGTRCMTWTGDLIDMRLFIETGNADTLYVKVASSTPVSPSKNILVKVVPAAVIGSLLLILPILFLLWRNKSKKQGPVENQSSTTDFGRDEIQGSPRVQPPTIMQVTDVKRPATQNPPKPVIGSDRMLGILPIYDLSSVKAATNDFSVDNVIGEGGYGIVYKGQLQNGQVIAVKRFLRLPLQVPDMFKNEVKLIANLQHINLIRLLGCCVEDDEKILILEYMENGSLDTYIYDKTKSILLDWRMRLDIIMGVAQGLLYLHRDSNLKVIHRDLKPSNILLDLDMNPRITDFGISRIYEGGRFHEKATTRPVGTLPYMAPEYISAGIFSFKSDVFGFGVILLEILSGRKNTLINLADSRLNLLASAYNLWKEGRSLEILDGTLDDSYPLAEIMRCIRVGLLCVEEKSEDRPTMAQVVRMLSSEEVMPTPRMGPAVGVDRHSQVELSTSNEISVTLEAR